MRKVYDIFIRYIIIGLFGLGNLIVFYNLFTFPTLFISKSILSLFGEAIFADNFILFNDSLLEVANSCVSGSAYYLLFILSMSIPLGFVKRISVILYSFLSFFILNVFRIVFMGLIANTILFDTVHIIFWQILSTIFVIMIWFSAVKLFRLEGIPFYTDFLCIKKTKNSKTRKKHN